MPTSEPSVRKDDRRDDCDSAASSRLSSMIAAYEEKCVRHSLRTSRTRIQKKTFNLAPTHGFPMPSVNDLRYPQNPAKFRENPDKF